MKKVTAYVDGACVPNPGRGGWGALLIYSGHERRLHGGEPHTTNNRMELMAAIMALETLKQPCHVTLFTDSNYVVNGMTEGRKRRLAWKKKKPMPSADYWQRLDGAAARHTVLWKWVRGHDGNPGNEEADRLANLGVASVLA